MSEYIKIIEEKDLGYWQSKYEAAKNAYQENIDRLKKNESQYDGKPINSKGAETKCFYNFTMELIESSFDNGIPQPKVTARVQNDKNNKLARIAEDMIKSELKRLSFNVINDSDERNAKIYGGDIAHIEWDNSVKTHDTSGAIDFQLMEDATQFIPQDGVYDVARMDYCFLTFSDTRERIERKYNTNVDMEGYDTDYTEGTPEDIVTQVVCYYRNDKGTIGCFSYCGNTVLIDDDEYHARADLVCDNCGKGKVIGEIECECGCRKFKKASNLDFEKITEDIELSDGTVIPAESYARDGYGNYLTKEVPVQREELNPLTGAYQPVYQRVFGENMQVIGDEPVVELERQTYKEPTKIPYYVPHNYPVIVRRNVSQKNNVLGLSDCEMIREQQEIANEAGTKLMSRLNHGGDILIKPASLNFAFTNGTQVLNITDPAQKAMIDRLQMSFDVTQEMNTINNAYMIAKSIMGINETSQGKADNTATSGKAKEVQVARALGRQASKVTMKNAFYQDIFKMIFEYMLAYSDEPRSFVAQSDEGDNTGEQFNRYEFLQQDEYGNWYYYDDFEFDVDNSGTANEDRDYILEMMQADFNNGLYGDPATLDAKLNFWKDRDLYNYPGSKRQIARLKKLIEQQLQAMQISEAKEVPAEEGGAVNDQMQM